MNDENGDRPLKEEVDEIRVHFQSEIESIKTRLETLERGAATKNDEQADGNEPKSPNFVPRTFEHSTPIADEPKEANEASERLTNEENGQAVKQHVDREEQRKAASNSANALLNQTVNSFTLPRVFDDAQLSFSLQPEDRKDERSLRLNVTEEDSSPAKAEQKPPASVERPAASTSTAPASPSSFQMKPMRTREEKLAALARIQQGYMPVKPVENTPPTNADQTDYTNQTAGFPYALNQSYGYPCFPVQQQQQQADSGHVPPQGPFGFLRSPLAQLNQESFNCSADTRSFHLPPGQENIFTPPTTQRPPMPPKPGDRLWFPPHTPVSLPTGIPLTPAYTTKPNDSTRTPERTRESGRERKEKASGSRKGRGKWAELIESSSSSEDDSTTSSSRSISPDRPFTCHSKHSSRGHRGTESLRTARGHDSIAHGYRASSERYAPNPRAYREHGAVSSRSTPHRPPPPSSRHTHRNEVDELLHDVLREPQMFAGELKRLLEDPVVFRRFDAKRKVDDWQARG
ncbi:hypothetical protein M3Y99_01326500 [Aphelenchoides fujianensis]|nr:hypothetical protein M3Y99_01326500 [Aphelenchoides fujianensis]